jgi:glycosyltransferase involved in cell wall biosynthesis
MYNKDQSQKSLAIIIPFFNEEKRMEIDSFIQFISENNNCFLFLINDGSTDNTLQLIKQIKNASPLSVELIDLKKNTGKGNAIRTGMEKAIELKIPYTSFIDADLSVSFEELMKLFSVMKAQNYNAVFGSRLKKLGSTINRSAFRHYTGRMIATIIDSRFQIGCYDTQCSAKIFKTSLLPPLIQQSFFTSWFFDVEIILRARKLNSDLNAIEIPLDNWVHKPGSKLNLFSFFTVLKELHSLFKKY